MGRYPSFSSCNALCSVAASVALNENASPSAQGRSPLGELVYQLKYRGQQAAAAEVAAVMAEKEKGTFLYIDCKPRFG